MLYWLKRYDEQNNNTMTIEIFKSYISNEKTGGSDGGARPLPASTGRHVAEPSPVGGGRKKMEVVTETYVHCLSAHADAWPSLRLREVDARWGQWWRTPPTAVSTRWYVAEPPPARRSWQKERNIGCVELNELTKWFILPRKLIH